MFRRFLPVAAAVLLLTAAPVRADDAEDQAVKAVQKLGGMVVRDDKDSARPVTEVHLDQTKVTDAGLKELAALKGLKTLSLFRCNGVTDAGLRELAGLKGLKALALGGTQVTDAGLRELAGLKGLKDLSLFDCKGVTDAGVAELQKALPDCGIIH